MKKLINKAKQILINFKKATVLNTKAVVRTIFASITTLVIFVGGIVLIAFTLHGDLGSLEKVGPILALIGGGILILISLFELLSVKREYSVMVVSVAKQDAIKAAKDSRKANVKAEAKAVSARDSRVEYNKRQDKNRLD